MQSSKGSCRLLQAPVGASEALAGAAAGIMVVLDEARNMTAEPDWVDWVD